jgi:hypothetical protein
MKQALKGFLCTDEARMFVGDTHEMVLFLQTVCMIAGIDPYIDDTDALISSLDEQIKARFSENLQILPVDADTSMPATKHSEEIFLAISTTEDLTVH